MQTTRNVTKEIAAETMAPPRGRRRWFVLALLFSITVVNFIDRQTVSVLAPVLKQILHLTDTQYGRVVAAFQFGMMTGELPMGALMDRWGVRLGLMGAVLWWSGATGMQSLARTGTQLGLTRFWMGTGECGNYSGGLKVVSRLFSPRERTLAIGIFNSGSMIGATIAPPLIVWLLQRYGFRAAFLLAAALGVLWLPLWYWVYREPASEAEEGIPQGLKPLASTTFIAKAKALAYPEAEARALPDDPSPIALAYPEAEARQLPGHPGPAEPASTKVSIRDRSLWAVMLCRFFIGPVMQFYWYWIPSYLFTARHLSLSQIGFLAWIPFLLGDIGGLAGGGAAGLLQGRGLPIGKVRRWTMYTSSLLCVASLLVPLARSTALAFLLIGVAMLADNFLSANMFGSMTDLFPEHQLGRVTGFSGVAGGLSGLLFPLLTGVLVDRFSYTPVFFLVALMPLAGTVALFLFGGPGYQRIALEAASAKGISR